MGHLAPGKGLNPLSIQYLNFDNKYLSVVLKAGIVTGICHEKRYLNVSVRMEAAQTASNVLQFIRLGSDRKVCSNIVALW